MASAIPCTTSTIIDLRSDGGRATPSVLNSLVGCRLVAARVRATSVTVQLPWGHSLARGAHRWTSRDMIAYTTPVLSLSSALGQVG